MSNSSHSKNSPASIKAETTTRVQKLTTENRSKIPGGPSNLSAYLQCDEAFERRALGLPSNRSQHTVAQYLEEWEAEWKIMSTK